MLGILCGLESEAKIARKIANSLTACAAARPLKARELARDLVRQGATSLISFGIAGSLSSSLKLGDIVIGTRIVSANSQWVCHDKWGQALAIAMPQAKISAVYGSETLIATVQDKGRLHQSTGCDLVDMESQCAAEIAAESGLPLIVVRAICDDANMNVPPVVMAAVAQDGSVDVLAAISTLIRQPSQFGALFHVMQGTGKALTALRRAAASISEPSR